MNWAMHRQRKQTDESFCGAHGALAEFLCGSILPVKFPYAEPGRITPPAAGAPLPCVNVKDRYSGGSSPNVL